MSKLAKKLIAFSLALAFMATGGTVSAQNPPPTTADLKKQKEDAEAQRDAFKAQLEAELARRAYEAALDPAKQTEAAQVAAVKTAKDTADAQTATANAQKAQSEAELAALKKRFGDFQGSGIGGAAEVTGSAGSAEATLLGSVAVNRIATHFADSLKSSKLPSDFVFVTSTTVPDFQALTAFEVQFLAIKTAIDTAKLITSVKPEENAAMQTESVATIGLGLDAVSKILSFAKTDYKFVNFELSSTDSMLMRALAGMLSGVKTVQIPAVYVADVTAATNQVMTRAGEINKGAVEAKGRIKFYEAAQVEFEKRLVATPNDPTLKEGLQKAKTSLATWKAVSEAVDAWSKQLTAADDKGNSLIATVARQSAIRRKLDAGAAMVIIELHKVAGTGYTKKNLWSSLGANPFFVMGGAVASYVVLDGVTGTVLDAQLQPFHGGYYSISDVRGAVNPGRISGN